METTIPKGAVAETISDVMRRLGRKKSWLYDRIKTDPSFPRPFYLGPREPRFFQHEIDAWLKAKADEYRAQPDQHEAAISAAQKSALAGRQRDMQEVDHAMA